MGIDLPKVKEEIKLWNRFRNDKEKFQDLKDLRAFDFESGDKLPGGSDVHVYPGLKVDGTPSFYLISALYDKSTLERDLSKNIIEAIPLNDVNIADAPLPGSIAHDRILCWGEYFNTWIESAADHDAVFEAFVVPYQDLPGLQPKVVAYFGLIPNLADEGVSYNVDLILTSGQQVVFEDTVMPVPPFGRLGKTDKSNFFLLELSLK